MAKKMSHGEWLKMVEEFKKDPRFMKALDKFIDISTNRVYKLKKSERYY